MGIFTTRGKTQKIQGEVRAESGMKEAGGGENDPQNPGFVDITAWTICRLSASVSMVKSLGGIWLGKA